MGDNALAKALNILAKTRGLPSRTDANLHIFDMWNVNMFYTISDHKQKEITIGNKH